MSLIKSISGIRGTIGGKQGENLTPIDIVECTAGFGKWLINNGGTKKIVIGRDGRITGQMLTELASQTLIAMGIDVVDLGYSTTPTVEMGVVFENAGAGIIFTASHNPKQWNALKFVNHKGEFISAADGDEVLGYIDEKDIRFADIDDLGIYTKKDDFIAKHIDVILDMDEIDIDAIKSKKYHIVVDCINSTGAISIPPLLDRLGCTYTLLNEEVNGVFAHNPEPLPKNLVQISNAVIEHNADMGIVVDPDVDRLAFVNEDGSMFGEEYTIVAIADYLLSLEKGTVVSNLSSSRALSDMAQKHGGDYFASAVGEVNVVNMMKDKNAVFGGEGNGGVIVPKLHYGRDALVGIGLFLTHLSKESKSMTELRASYPDYIIIKDKMQLKETTDLDAMFAHLKSRFSDEKLNTIDGFKIDFEKGWVHIRKSNTEPIIRIYAESKNKEMAEEFVSLVKNEVKPFV